MTHNLGEGVVNQAQVNVTVKLVYFPLHLLNQHGERGSGASKPNSFFWICQESPVLSPLSLTKYFWYWPHVVPSALLGSVVLGSKMHVEWVPLVSSPSSPAKSFYIYKHIFMYIPVCTVWAILVKTEISEYKEYWSKSHLKHGVFHLLKPRCCNPEGTLPKWEEPNRTGR